MTLEEKIGVPAMVLNAMAVKMSIFPARKMIGSI